MINYKLNTTCEITCKFCKKIDACLMVDTQIIAQNEFNLYECDECGIQFWEPFRNPGAEWYTNEATYAGRNKDPNLKPNVNHKRIIDCLKPFCGKVLGIGCGTGNFLNWARSNGWQVFGFDFDADAVSVAKKAFSGFCRNYRYRQLL